MTGAIPNIASIWHGTTSKSRTFTMNINEHNGSGLTGTLYPKFPGLIFTAKPISGEIENDGTLAITMSRIVYLQV